jgi:hypothetical protein
LLPFLKKNSGQAGLIVKEREPDSDNKEMATDDLAEISQDLINAVHAHDKQGVMDALSAAFACLDAQPHEEGEHISPHSYDSQNQKAAE